MRRYSTKEYEKGKIAVTFKPYKIDLKEIDALTRNEYNNNQSDTLRVLVREALLHRRLVRDGRDATMGIVRDTQKDVINSQLHPLIVQIDNLDKTIKSFQEQQCTLTNNIANNITNSTAKITEEISAVREEINRLIESGNGAQIITAINKNLQNLTALLQPLAVRSTDTLRNIIVMRSLFYFFLIAYQSGSIDEAHQLSKKQWVYFVRDMSKRAGQLSVDEYTSLDTIGQHKFIEDYARNLFEEVQIIKLNEIPKIPREPAPDFHKIEILFFIVR